MAVSTIEVVVVSGMVAVAAAEEQLVLAVSMASLQTLDGFPWQVRFVLCPNPYY